MKTLYKILFSAIFLFFIQMNAVSQITGPGGTFNTFSDVITYLNGISSFTSDLTYEVMPGTYNEQIMMPYLSANTNNFKIIFQRKAGETGEILVSYAPSGTDGNYVIKIEGAHYQFRDIHFQNTSSESNGKGRVLTFFNSNNYNDDNWFKNCKFTGITVNNQENILNPDFAVIGYNEDYYISNTQLENDTVTGGSYGIYLEHWAIRSYDIGIKDCYIENFTSSGIYLSNMGNIIISGNHIKSSFGNGIDLVSGIVTLSADLGVSISANKIDLTGQANKTCINLSNISTTTSCNVDNNMLTTRNGNTSYTSYGVYLNSVSAGSPYILYNSIYIQDGDTNSSAFKIQSTNNITSFNNLFLNSGNGSAAELEAQTQLQSSGNNVYYTPSDTMTVVQSGNNYSLRQWQFLDTQNLVELNSFYALPHFVAPDDLHILSQEYTVVEGRADSNWNSMAAHDFDRNTRDNLFPDIGADEGKFTLLWVGNIYDNVIWHGSFFVKDTVDVSFISMAKSGNLTILPNTTIKFLDKAMLNVGGTINANGLKDSSIVFTAADTLQPWAGIRYNTSEISHYNFCKFEYSAADSGGVFKFIDNYNSEINHSVFYKNTATEYGGAIYCRGSYPIINANMFYENSAQEGGAIYHTGVEPAVLNNVFYDNSATNYGGAVAVESTESPGRIYNNTFYNNIAGNAQGHDLYLNSTNTQISNCIFWGNDINTRVYEINGTGNIITSCIIKGNSAGTNNGSPGIIPCTDPGFVNISNHNFAVQPNSVAIDTGSYYTNSENDFDYTGKSRIYNYSFGGQIDIGAYELQAPKLVADAGADVSECNSAIYFYNIFDPYPYSGNLTTNNPDINIVTNESTPYATNIPPGTTEFYWTVTNGVVSDLDTFLVINTQPYVNAGEDIFMINPDISNNIYPDTMFNANPPQGTQTGYWTQLSGNPVTLGNISSYNSVVSDITYGQHLFQWTISDAGCMNSDSVMLIAGHSFVSAPDDGVLDWNNPADWDVNGVPGSADSVTVYNCTANVNVSDALCDRLIVGNGGDLYFEGTAKAPAVFNCRTVFIEQNAEKFKNTKGTANIHVSSDATVNIGSGYLSKSLSTTGSGLFIGGGGTVFIEQNAEKASKAGAGLNIGNGGVIFIEQNAEKGVGNAEFHIGDGGYVFMEQNAEKNNTLKGAGNSDFYIGNGGYVFMEQNAEKGVGGYMHIGAGRTVFIEQNAEKSTSGGGHFALYGGTVFIEQNAEKKEGKSLQNPGLFVGSGGTIFIEQNAEKALSNPTLIVPQVVIDGGQIKVGSNVKAKSATDVFQFRQIFIEQNAEKNALDTALTVYPSGAFVLSDSSFWNSPEIKINSGNIVEFAEGSQINMSNNSFEQAMLYVDEGASFIDYNPATAYFGERTHLFNGAVQELYSPVIKTFDMINFYSNIDVASWSESNYNWLPVPSAENLYAGKGYLFKPETYDTTAVFFGDYGQGDISIPVTADNPGFFELQGWNMLGNPYPSYINLEETTIPYEINKAFYFVSTDNPVVKIYKQGGISINGASQFVAPSEVFLVKADANSNFVFNNSSRVHYPQSGSGKAVSNILKLKAENSDFSDEIALSFDVNAIDNFDSEYDAVKFMSSYFNYPQFYSTLQDNTPMAINTVADFSDSKTIPLYFNTMSNGTYNLSVSEINFTEDVSVTLKDLKNNSTQDLIANPSYSFTSETGDDPNRFEIIFAKAGSDIKDFISEKVNIYASRNRLFVNVPEEESVLQIYDVEGKLLFQKNIEQGHHSFNLNYPNAVYFVKIISNKKITDKKIVLFR